AFGRLDSCDSDSDLTALAKSCLAADREARPTDGQTVSAAMSKYLASIEEKLQAAEIERAAALAKSDEAKARAKAERKARYRTLGIAVAMLLLLAGIGVGTWWWTGQRSQAAQLVQQAIDSADNRLNEARKKPAGELEDFRAAVAAANKAVDLANNPSTPQIWRDRANLTLVEMKNQMDAAERDAKLLSGSIPFYVNYPALIDDEEADEWVEGGNDADRRIADAFRDWGLDIDTAPFDSAYQHIKSRPRAVGVSIVAILDVWVIVRQWAGRPDSDWRHLADLANQLDIDQRVEWNKEAREFRTRIGLPADLGPSEAQIRTERSELRAIIARNNLTAERTVAEISHVLMPYTVLTALVPGHDCNRLRKLAQEPYIGWESDMYIILLAGALRLAGDETEALRLFQTAEE